MKERFKTLEKQVQDNFDSVNKRLDNFQVDSNTKLREVHHCLAEVQREGFDVTQAVVKRFEEEGKDLKERFSELDSETRKKCEAVENRLADISRIREVVRKMREWK